MSKERIGRLSSLCLLVLLWMVNGAARPSALEPDDPLIGTWVNDRYNGNADFSARFVIFPDCRELDYDSVASTEPEYETRFTVDETWTDSEGNHWYKTHGATDFYPYKEPRYRGFGFIKISAAGSEMVSVGSEIDYPEELSPIGGAYATYRRQE
jgi:hypothetical protein